MIGVLLISRPVALPPRSGSTPKLKRRCLASAAATWQQYARRYTILLLSFTLDSPVCPVHSPLPSDSLLISSGPAKDTYRHTPVYRLTSSLLLPVYHHPCVCSQNSLVCISLSHPVDFQYRRTTVQISFTTSLILFPLASLLFARLVSVHLHLFVYCLLLRLLSTLFPLAPHRLFHLDQHLTVFSEPHDNTSCIQLVIGGHDHKKAIVTTP